MSKQESFHNFSNCLPLHPFSSRSIDADHQPKRKHPSMIPKPRQIPRVCMGVWYSTEGQHNPRAEAADRLDLSKTLEDRPKKKRADGEKEL